MIALLGWCDGSAMRCKDTRTQGCSGTYLLGIYKHRILRKGDLRFVIRQNPAKISPILATGSAWSAWGL